MASSLQPRQELRQIHWTWFPWVLRSLGCAVFSKGHPNQHTRTGGRREPKGNLVKPPKETQQCLQPLFWALLKKTKCNRKPVLKSRHPVVEGGGLLARRGGGCPETQEVTSPLCEAGSLRVLEGATK